MTPPDLTVRQVAATTKYPPEAFAFVQRGLAETVARIHGEAEGEGDDEAHASRHVSGRQLCEGLRDFAIERYGLLARTVLRRWRIHESRDFGHIVFALVDAELMRKSDEDQISDFDGVYTFSEAFDIEIKVKPPDNAPDAPPGQSPA